MNEDDRTMQADRLIRLLGFLERDPENLTLIHDAAQTALRAGSVEQARLLIERGLSLPQADASRKVGFGHLLLAAQDYDRADALFASLAQQPGAPPGVFYDLAYARWFRGQYADAVAILQGIAEGQRSGLPQYDLLLGKALYYNQQLDEALQHLDRFLQADPGNREGLGLRALAAFDAGQPASAEMTARRLLAAFPQDVLGHLTLASIALEQKATQQARAHLDPLLKESPEMGRAWSVLGFVDLQENKLDEAIPHFEQAVRFMPDHLGTWHGLAWSQLLRSNLPAARAAVDRAMEVDRNFAENHGTLAVISIAEGRIEEAEASIKRGLRLDAKSPSSHYARSLLYAERGDAATSKKLIERILTGRGMQVSAELTELIVGFRPWQGGMSKGAKTIMMPSPDKKTLH